MHRESKPTLINFIRIAIAVMWKATSGRWYIFRDAPLWFIQDTIDIWEKHKAEGSEIHPTLFKFYLEAQAEMRQRRENAIRFDKLEEFEEELAKWQ